MIDHKANALLALFILFIACDELAPEPAITEETTQLSCYQEMMATIPDGWNGTGCHLCGSYSAGSLDTMTYVSAFYSENVLTNDSENYSLQWDIGKGARIIGSDTSRTLKVVFEEGFEEVRVSVYADDHLGNECSSSFRVRNAGIDPEIGDYGQGGIVLYDKGESSDDWRFIEVTSSIINPWTLDDGMANVAWGCSEVEIGANATGIGSGADNCATLVDYECTVSPSAVFAYDISLSHVNNGQSDWVLPSLEEARLIYENFPVTWANQYYIWTSSEIDEQTAYAIDLVSGEVMELNKNEKVKVMAVRYFE